MLFSMSFEGGADYGLKSLRVICDTYVTRGIRRKVPRLGVVCTAKS